MLAELRALRAENAALRSTVAELTGGKHDECQWAFGALPCTLLMLPAGEPLRLAIKAASHVQQRLGGSRLVGINPSAADTDNLLIRTHYHPWHQHPPHRPGGDRTVWLKRGMPQQAFPGEDARALWHNGQLLAFYSLATGSRIGMVRRVLSDSGSPALQLHLVGMEPAPIEKNWAPLPYRDQLFLSYRLEPVHMVLRCDWSSGACSPAFNATSLSAEVWRVHGRFERPRLTTPTVRVRGALVGVGHYRTSTDAVYVHFFYELQPEPPFALRRVSPMFRFFTRRRASQHGETTVLRAGLDEDLSFGPVSVQFVSGLYHDKEARQLVLTYGVGDRASMQTTVGVETVFELLRNEEDGHANHAFCSAGDASSGAPNAGCDERSCHNASSVTLTVCPTMCIRLDTASRKPAVI